MKLKSNFSSNLNFQPLSLWPDTVPALALGTELLCGFHLPSDHPVFVHPQTSPELSLNLLKSIYPQLTLSELARLIRASSFDLYFQKNSLLKIYGFSTSPETFEIFNLLYNSSKEFQDFVSLKKMGPQELYPLLSLNSESQHFITGEILRAEESKQESVKRLETLSDLIQMSHEVGSLKNLSLSQLLQKRFPVTCQRDQSLSSASLPWLSQIKTQFKRRGDKAGFEVQFFAGTPAELNKLAQNLTKVAQEWNSNT